MTRFYNPALCGLVIAGATAGSAWAAGPACRLSAVDSPIKHFVYLQFDNTHLLRDHPDVPSDLEQMPHLMQFLTSQGVLQSNNHTQIVSHTANGLLNTMTGVYPDRLGSAISNDFLYYQPDGTTADQYVFNYWTDKVQTSDSRPAADHAPVLVTRDGRNAPAPWVAFTRAGCDVGVAAMADMELESTTPDVANVFGAHSPEAHEANKNPNRASYDFQGITLHCAQGSGLCAANGVPDLLPDEPGGYQGFRALFGHRYVVPKLTGGSRDLPDLLGGTIGGFPGYGGMTPAVTLSYAAAMLEAGVPVFYGYLTNAHESVRSGNSFGPGEAAYVQQLQQFDAGFAAFFARLAADGINASNTLFVITVEEGDHFVGSRGRPAGCDGVRIACTYSKIGEVDGDLSRLVATQFGLTTPFTVHSDMAPAYYVQGQPGAADPQVRALERAAAGLTVTDPLLARDVALSVGVADREELKVLHMVSGDDLRTPSFVQFAQQDFYLSASGKTTSCDSGPPCVFEYNGDAWNHGGIQAPIRTTWLGLVGPGVLQRGVDAVTWSDHVDVRPTVMMLMGLRDDYAYDGRVLVEDLDPNVLPAAIAADRQLYIDLASTYKQLTAPFGRASMATIKISTRGVAGDKALYQRYRTWIESFRQRRDATAQAIDTLLQDAAIAGQRLPFGEASALKAKAAALISEAETMASAGQL